MKDGRPDPTVLLLGGDAEAQAAARAALDGGFECLAAGTAAEAWQAMSDNFVQVVLCLGDVGGSSCAAVFARMQGHWPETMLVAVEDGCSEEPPEDTPNLHQIVPKDWTAAGLLLTVRQAARVFHLTRENERLALEMQCLAPVRGRPRTPPAARGFEQILRAPGSRMGEVVDEARQVASYDVPVLLSGEPGTGRGALAEAIHLSSLRSDQPFVALELTGLSDAAVARTLFGEKRTEAGRSVVGRTGLIRRAGRGTLYLSGVEGLGPDLQRRLARLVRDGQYEQDGVGETQSAEARVLASIAGEPQRVLDAGTLEPSLYYALSVAELAVPPLRARQGDIPVLARAAAEDAAATHGKAFQAISAAAAAFLTAYAWPGNLRELENEVTRMLIRAQAPVLGPDLISRHILQAAPAGTVDDLADAESEMEIMARGGTLKDRLEAMEARILRETLTRLKWNKSRSAAELGLSRVGLRAKLDRHGLAPPEREAEEG